MLVTARSHLGSSLRRLASFFFKRREYCAKGCATPKRHVGNIPNKHIRRLKQRAESDPQAVQNLVREQQKAFAAGFVTPFERDIELCLLIAIATEAFLAHEPEVHYVHAPDVRPAASVARWISLSGTTPRGRTHGQSHRLPYV